MRVRAIVAVAWVTVACSRPTAPPATKASADPVPARDATADAPTDGWVDAAADAPADATSDVRVGVTTGLLMRIVDRHADKVAPFGLHSSVVIELTDDHGLVTKSTVDLPCWAHPEGTDLSCVFGASYEKTRLEKKAGQCAVVTDFFGERTGEKKNVRRLVTFPCADLPTQRVEEVPGLPLDPN